MAYATTNPPAMLTNRVGGSGALWMYRSTDPSGDVDASNYFSNGEELGMKTGDVVFVVDTDTSNTLTIHSVTEVSSDGATVSAAI